MDAGRAIRDARTGAGLTQQQLAELAGTSQATLSAYESGRKRPAVDTLGRILAAAGSRLAVQPATVPVIRVSRERMARNARVLVDVIALAEALPSRPARRLNYPRLP
jgi:transcriptional regulator with XRE-family HTH domain